MDHEKLKGDVDLWAIPLKKSRKDIASGMGIAKSYLNNILTGQQPATDPFWIRIEAFSKGKIKQENYK